MAQRSFTCKNVELASSLKIRLELKNHYSHATNQNILFVLVKVLTIHTKQANNITNEQWKGC